MSEKRIADRRLYGRDAHGREVLVAAKGQPIPKGWEDTDDGLKQSPEARRPRPRADESVGERLNDLTREELDERARAAGVEDPEELPNKEAVVAALRGD